MKRPSDDALFVKLLEYYVLHSIGELTDDKQAEAKRIESHLQTKYQLTDTWFEMISATLNDLPIQQHDMVRIWNKYSGWASQRGAIPDPEAFAVSYVDQHYALPDMMPIARRA